MFAALYAYRLGFPTGEYFDEVYHVKSAREYLAASPVITDTVHPPLGKLMMALGINLLGDHSWAWRLPSLLCGLMFIPVFFALTRILTGSRGAALVSALLMAIEGMHLTQSRIAMLNAPMILAMYLSLLSLLPYLTRQSGKRTRAFFASGFFLAMAVSLRWVGGLVALTIFPFLLVRFFEEKKKGEFLRDFALFFFLLPLLVYTASHQVLLLTPGKHAVDIWNYQRHMWGYHSKLTATHGYGSAWWGWPLLVRPIWYFFERREGWVFGILCIGNPAIYWMFPLALAYSLFKWLEERRLVYGFILAGFFSQWLPWIWVSRVKFFHYFYAAVPFAVIAVAMLLRGIAKIDKLGEWIVLAYLSLAIALFIYWYPLYVGYPISEVYFQHHLWFKAWI